MMDGPDGSDGPGGPDAMLRLGMTVRPESSERMHSQGGASGSGRSVERASQVIEGVPDGPAHATVPFNPGLHELEHTIEILVNNRTYFQMHPSEFLEIRTIYWRPLVYTVIGIIGRYAALIVATVGIALNCPAVNQATFALPPDPFPELHGEAARDFFQPCGLNLHLRTLGSFVGWTILYYLFVTLLLVGWGKLCQRRMAALLEFERKKRARAENDARSMAHGDHSDAYGTLVMDDTDAQLDEQVPVAAAAEAEAVITISQPAAIMAQPARAGGARGTVVATNRGDLDSTRSAAPRGQDDSQATTAIRGDVQEPEYIPGQSQGGEASASSAAAPVVLEPVAHTDASGVQATEPRGGGVPVRSAPKKRGAKETERTGRDAAADATDLRATTIRTTIAAAHALGTDKEASVATDKEAVGETRATGRTERASATTVREQGRSVPVAPVQYVPVPRVVPAGASNDSLELEVSSERTDNPDATGRSGLDPEAFLPAELSAPQVSMEIEETTVGDADPQVAASSREASVQVTDTSRLGAMSSQSSDTMPVQQLSRSHVRPLARARQVGTTSEDAEGTESSRLDDNMSPVSHLTSETADSRPPGTVQSTEARFGKEPRGTLLASPGGGAATLSSARGTAQPSTVRSRQTMGAIPARVPTKPGRGARGGVTGSSSVVIGMTGGGELAAIEEAADEQSERDMHSLIEEVAEDDLLSSRQQLEKVEREAASLLEDLQEFATSHFGTSGMKLVDQHQAMFTQVEQRWRVRPKTLLAFVMYEKERYIQYRDAVGKFWKVNLPLHSIIVVNGAVIMASLGFAPMVVVAFVTGLFTVPLAWAGMAPKGHASVGVMMRNHFFNADACSDIGLTMMITIDDPLFGGWFYGVFTAFAAIGGFFAVAIYSWAIAQQPLLGRGDVIVARFFTTCLVDLPLLAAELYMASRISELSPESVLPQAIWGSLAYKLVTTVCHIVSLISDAMMKRAFSLGIDRKVWIQRSCCCHSRRGWDAFFQLAEFMGSIPVDFEEAVRRQHASNSELVKGIRQFCSQAVADVEPTVRADHEGPQEQPLIPINEGPARPPIVI
jgi:hypothetical protein